MHLVSWTVAFPFANVWIRKREGGSYECLSDEDRGVSAPARPCCSSRWMAMENRRQKEGSLMPAIAMRLCMLWMMAESRFALTVGAIVVY